MQCFLRMLSYGDVTKYYSFSEVTLHAQSNKKSISVHIHRKKRKREKSSRSPIFHPLNSDANGKTHKAAFYRSRKWAYKQGLIWKPIIARPLGGSFKLFRRKRNLRVSLFISLHAQLYHEIFATRYTYVGIDNQAKKVGKGVIFRKWWGKWKGFILHRIAGYFFLYNLHECCTRSNNFTRWIVNATLF